ncbi:MAG: YceI family protein [Balneolaceae bacterium]|nr:YceI family protein [Balneolaceae bacterium]
MKTNKKLFTLLTVSLVALFAAAFTIPEPTSWTIDKTHSAINFKVIHFFTPVNGEFREYESTIHFDPENLEESMIDVKIMVSSIDTDNQRRNNHLQSGDFFNAEKYPHITFTSNSIRSTNDDTFVAEGTLTIKDVSKDFSLPFKLLGIKDHPMRDGKLIAGMTSNFTLDRTEFDVGVGDWASDAVVGDEVTVDLNLELNADK